MREAWSRSRLLRGQFCLHHPKQEVIMDATDFLSGIITPLIWGSRVHRGSRSVVAQSQGSWKRLGGLKRFPDLGAVPSKTARFLGVPWTLWIATPGPWTVHPPYVRPCTLPNVNFLHFNLYFFMDMLSSFYVYLWK